MGGEVSIPTRALPGSLTWAKDMCRANPLSDHVLGRQCTGYEEKSLGVLMPGGQARTVGVRFGEKANETSWL